MGIDKEREVSGEERAIKFREHNSWLFLLELSVVTSLVLFFFGFLMYRYAISQQERNTDIVAESYLMQIRDSMALWLDGEVGMIRSIATDVDVIQAMVTPNDPEAVRAAEHVIRGTHRARAHYTVISLVANQVPGGEMNVTRRGASMPIRRGMIFADSIDGEAIGINALDYNYGKAAFGGSNFFISSVKDSALDVADSVFVISSRVEKGGKLVGIVCVGIKLDYFSTRFIRSDVLGATVELSVVDDRGYVIAAYDRNVILKSKTRAKMNELLALGQDSHRIGSGFRSDPVDPEKREIMTRRLNLSGGEELDFENQWYLLLSKEKEVLFGGSKDYLKSNIMSITVFSSILMMSVIAAIGWVFIRKVRSAQRELENINEELERSSRTDTLTGLPNRRAYAEMAHKLESGRVAPLGIISLDVDGLKIINDMLGHVAGDKLLVDAAKLLTDAIQEPAQLFRTGGDEFTVLCPGCGEDILSGTQERISHRLAEQEHDFTTPSVHISCGYSVRNDAEISLEELFQDADDRMYRYKRLNNMQLRQRLLILAENALLQSEPNVDDRRVIRKDLIDMLSSLRAEYAPFRDSLLLLSRYYRIGRAVRANADEGGERYFAGSRAEDQRVAEMGFRIAMVFPQTLSIAHLILRQHEWWSEREDVLLAGQDEQPMECRIFAVLETFESQFEGHRGDLVAGCKKGLAAICGASGKRLDPDIVDFFASEVVPKFCSERGV